MEFNSVWAEMKFICDFNFLTLAETKYVWYMYYSTISIKR